MYGADIGGLIRAMMILIVAMFPFALWKVGEIAWWLATHISVSWS